MATISIKCTGCKNVLLTTRTNEIPDDVKSLECNWCPACSDEPDEDYLEKYIYEEEEIFNPNQITLF